MPIVSIRDTISLVESHDRIPPDNRTRPVWALVSATDKRVSALTFTRVGAYTFRVQWLQPSGNVMQVVQVAIPARFEATSSDAQHRWEQSWATIPYACMPLPHPTRRQMIHPRQAVAASRAAEKFRMRAALRVGARSVAVSPPRKRPNPLNLPALQHPLQRPSLRLRRSRAQHLSVRRACAVVACAVESESRECCAWPSAPA